MKRILTIATFCSLAGLSAWAAPQTLTGQIGDSMCGKSHAGMGEMARFQEYTGWCRFRRPRSVPADAFDAVAFDAVVNRFAVIFSPSPADAVREMLRFT